MKQEKTTAIHFAFVLWKQIKASSKIYGFAKNMRDFNGLVFDWMWFPLPSSLSLGVCVCSPDNITEFSMAMQKNEYLTIRRPSQGLKFLCPRPFCVHSIRPYIYAFAFPPPRSLAFFWPDRICICELLAMEHQPFRLNKWISVWLLQIF